ncbi:hypothetical protein DDZ13_09665 [Coraliomargarita sinensis]|uniref:DUF4325 domain-containing protein n=1 Tax=Coraliomargarita sinensis TaxID=2174842 RepID=A0A317ZHX3_9BACT|nr:hypothetical protein [Coraliomargarita sinensis]PXA03897.1 hypothetical protein DDZ13_09665 [Coraliomargarita sinensis]
MLLIELKKSFPETPYLWGASLGDDLWESVRDEVKRSNAQSDIVAVFDFEGVKATNASFLKASILPCFKEADLAVGKQVYPLVKNLAHDVEEEIHEIFHARKLPIQKILNRDNSFSGILGYIEPYLVDTLRLLAKTGPSSAPKLREIDDSGIGTTGWNNRLNELNALRLATRKKEGRSWIFQAIAKEIE